MYSSEGEDLGGWVLVGGVPVELPLTAVPLDGVEVSTFQVVAAQQCSFAAFLNLRRLEIQAEPSQAPSTCTHQVYTVTLSLVLSEVSEYITSYKLGSLYRLIDFYIGVAI